MYGAAIIKTKMRIKNSVFIDLLRTMSGHNLTIEEAMVKLIIDSPHSYPDACSPLIDYLHLDSIMPKLQELIKGLKEKGVIDGEKDLKKSLPERRPFIVYLKSEAKDFGTIYNETINRFNCTHVYGDIELKDQERLDITGILALEYDQCDIVVFKGTATLQDDVEIIARVYHDLNEKGIDIIFLNESIDSSTFEGRRSLNKLLPLL